MTPTVNVTCPHCRTTRQVRTHRTTVEGYSGQCPTCYTSRKKKSQFFTGRKYAAWRTSAKKRNLPWDLDRPFLDALWERQAGRCALTGRPMLLGESDRHNAASLDRIDPDVGYVENNVQFVLNVVNLMKNDLTEEQFRELCRDILDKGTR